MTAAICSLALLGRWLRLWRWRRRRWHAGPSLGRGAWLGSTLVVHAGRIPRSSILENDWPDRSSFDECALLEGQHGIPIRSNALWKYQQWPIALLPRIHMLTDGFQGGRSGILICPIHPNVLQVVPQLPEHWPRLD